LTIRIEKGKPFERVGPLLRLNAFTLSYAGPGKVEDESSSAKRGQSLRVYVRQKTLADKIVSYQHLRLLMR